MFHFKKRVSMDDNITQGSGISAAAAAQPSGTDNSTLSATAATDTAAQSIAFNNTVGYDTAPAAPPSAVSPAHNTVQVLVAEFHKIVAELNPSRELAIAKTKLEEFEDWIRRHFTKGK